MNCSEFEACIRDVAAERDIESFRRAEALEHANACSRCAARLSEERALVAGLQVLAGAARRETGAAHLEEALLRDFRRLERAKAAVPAPQLSVQSPETAWWRTPAYVGLAASVLLLLGWGLIQFTREPRMDQAQISPGPKSAGTFAGEGSCSFESGARIFLGAGSEAISPGPDPPTADLDTGGRRANSVCKADLQADCKSRSGKHCQ